MTIFVLISLGEENISKVYPKCNDQEEVTNGDVDVRCRKRYGCRMSVRCRDGYELVGPQLRHSPDGCSWLPEILPECVSKLTELKYHE